MPACMYKCAHTDVCECTCMYVWTCTCACVCVHTCMYMSLSACVIVEFDGRFCMARLLGFYLQFLNNNVFKKDIVSNVVDGKHL